MDEKHRNQEAVFRSRSQARCHEMWMVLDAAGVRARIARRRGTWLLLVPEADRPEALVELDDYLKEKPFEPRRDAPLGTPLSGGGAGVAIYVMLLVGVAGLAGRYSLGADWLEAGRMQSAAVVEGQWWRAFTALTLHRDAAHLVGNLAFGSVFGFLASQALGGGVAWLSILLAGGVGNLVNAYLQPPQHSAIGASTAVFAALGLLVALSLYHWRSRSGGVVRRWSPLVGGLILLAYTGMGGERTDVLAHVTGLASGLLVGALAGRLPAEFLERRDHQLGAGLLAGLLLLLSWAIALTGARGGA
jgi:membrane associated rhomboid family serine protease